MRWSDGHRKTVRDISQILYNLQVASDELFRHMSCSSKNKFRCISISIVFIRGALLHL